MRPWIINVALAALIVTGLIFFSVSPVFAATITVTTTADGLDSDGKCSLREAIRAADTNTAIGGCAAGASGADTIVVGAGTYLLTLTGTGDDLALSGDLDVRSDITITGPTTGAAIIDGNGTDRGFDVQPGARLTLSHLIVQHGNVPMFAGGGGGIRAVGSLTLRSVTVRDNMAAGGREYGQGGGIRNEDGTVILESSVVTNNQALPSGDTCTDSGGDGGGIWSKRGTLTIVNSEISSNRAEEVANDCGTGGAYGGGIWNSGGSIRIQRSTITDNGGQGILGEGGGLYTYRGTVLIEDSLVTRNNGGIANEGTMTIVGSTISDNIAQGAKRGRGGGGIRSLYDLTIERSTISGNQASGSGNNVGGGVLIQGTGVIRSSTVSGNTAFGGDVFGRGLGGGIWITGSVTIEDSTIAFNRALAGELPEDYPASGGGVVITSSGTLNMLRTIVANNTVDFGEGPDCNGTLTSLGYNLIRTTANCSITGVATGNRLGVDPLLAPLSDNGGRTKTHLLQPASPAIDNGPSRGCPATDQRGVARPQDGNDDGISRCDIGAFEVPGPDAPTPTPQPTTPPPPPIRRVFLPFTTK